MFRNQKNPESSFKTVFYKDVELFVHRDQTQKPAKLRLYDALSGLFVASELSKAEAVQLGLPDAVRGKNEEELLLILENRVKAVAKNGESFKNLLSRSRGNNPPSEKQQALLKAYRNTTAESTQAPVAINTTKVASVGDQTPRKEKIKMPVIQERRKCNLILHCGAQAVPRVKVARASTPRPTATWTPIPHLTLVETVEDALRSTGLKIGSQVHALGQDSAEYFGLTEVRGPNDPEDYTNVVGLRNSHNKRFPAALVIGSSVFVCDNLSFLGTIKLSRKHTRFIERDLPQLVGLAVGQLMDVFRQQDQRIAAYKNYRMKDKSAHDLIVRAFDVGACTNRMIPAVLKEYREPRHQEFSDRTAWSLFNAFTEVLKGNLPELPKRTQVLHGLFDTAVKLPPAHLN